MVANLILNKLIKVALFLFICSIAFGQLARLPLSNLFGAIYVSDLLLVIIIFCYLASVSQKGLIFLPQATQPMIIFILIALISLFASIRFFPSSELLPGSLLLVRFICYFALYLIIVNSLHFKERIVWANLLVVVAVIVALIGFLQLLVLPDLTFLTVYGWDPHINRLASTFLDPNFVGAFLVCGFILAQGLYLVEKKVWLLWSSLILVIATILTFSRSSYIMLFSSLLMLTLFKSKKIGMAFLILLFIAVVLIPKTQQRLVGAVTIDETAKARIISWQNAFTIFKDNYFIGVGFNNYRVAQAKYGFFEVSAPLGGHSGAGSDSTFLTIASTTGMFGLAAFLIGYFRLVLVSYFKRGDLLSLACFITLMSLLIHSQFVNSLLYPSLMAWVWILNGLVNINDNKK